MKILVAIVGVIGAGAIALSVQAAKQVSFCEAVDHPELLALNVSGSIPVNAVAYLRYVYQDGSVSPEWTSVANTKGSLNAWVEEHNVISGIVTVQVIDYKRTSDVSAPYVITSCQYAVT